MLFRSLRHTNRRSPPRPKVEDRKESCSCCLDSDRGARSRDSHSAQSSAVIKQPDRKIRPIQPSSIPPLKASHRMRNDSSITSEQAVSQTVFNAASQRSNASRLGAQQQEQQQQQYYKRRACVSPCANPPDRASPPRLPISAGVRASSASPPSSRPRPVPLGVQWPCAGIEPCVRHASKVGAEKDQLQRKGGWVDTPAGPPSRHT